MFEYASFAMRNPTHVTKHWRTQYATRKAILTHRKENPVCAFSGSKNRLQVHHKIPVSVQPELAADPNNLVTLTKEAHLTLGHGCDWKNFNPHIDKDIESVQKGIVKTKKYNTDSEKPND